MVDTLEDIILRHQVYLQRLVPQLGAEQIKMIDKNNPELRGELIQFLEDNEFYKLTKEQQNKLAVFRNKVYKLRGGAIDEAGAKYQGDMLNLAEREQVWFANGVEDLGGKSLAVSSSSALAKMVERQPFVGKTLNQIYSKLSVDDTDRVMTSVSDGLNSGLTKQQIQNQIFGTKKLGYTDGVLQQTRNYINNNNTNSGVVRTTVNGVSNESKRLLYEANSDIIDKVQYMATLDGRTSNICASRDGKIYKQGNEPPLPAHISCRSTYVPIIDGLDIESTRPYVADTRTRKEREKDFREQAKANGTTIKQERDKWKDKAIGQVSDKTTYQQWFDKQPASFQKEKLGKTKYELYKKGGMKFDRFQDPLNKSYTIDGLYKLDKNAFKKAGLGKGGKVLPKPAKKRTIKKEAVSFGYGGKYDKFADGISEDAKKIINKTPKPNKIEEGRGFYRSSEKLLSSPNKTDVFLHEYGHHVDSELNRPSSRLDKPAFLDSKNYKKKNREKLFNKWYEKKPEYYKKGRRKGQIAGYENILKEVRYGAFSDIVDSMSGGDFFETLGAEGHGKKYFKGPRARQRENFANLFQLWSENTHWKETRELFPNLTMEFENIIKDAKRG